LKVRALAAGSSGTPVSAYLREYLAFYKSLLFDR